MRRFSVLLLLASLFLFTGCDGVVIDLGSTPAATPDCSPQPNCDPNGCGPNGCGPKATPVLDPIPQPDNAEVLAFTAKWCSACKRDKPQIEEMRRRGVKVTEIDVDEQPSMARKYGIKQLPTYVVLDENGVEIERSGSIIAIVKIISVLLKIFIFMFG